VELQFEDVEEAAEEWHIKRARRLSSDHEQMCSVVEEFAGFGGVECEDGSLVVCLDVNIIKTTPTTQTLVREEEEEVEVCLLGLLHKTIEIKTINSKAIRTKSNHVEAKAGAGVVGGHGVVVAVVAM